METSNSSIRARYTGPLVVALGLIWLAAPGEAQAYLDPVTGNSIIQIILATLLAGLFAIKMYWRKLKAFFSGRPVQKDEQPRDATGSKGPQS